MKKFGLTIFSAVVIGLVSTPAFASTLTLVSTGGQVVNGVYIYPYNISIDGSTTTTALICLDFSREIQQGETWNATKNSIPTDNSAKSIDYRALALISASIQTNAEGVSTSDYQFAAWSIFDAAGLAGNSAYTTTAKKIAADALADAANPASTPHFDYSAFFFYAPIESNTTGWTNGIPQEFMGSTSFNPTYTPNLTHSPVPEPSGLLLFGTGILGAATVVRRKIVRA